jgi:signal transduction histidine kinase
VHTGYQVDILQAMLKKVRLKPTFSMMPLAGVLKTIKHGQADIALDLIQTEERSNNLLFSKQAFKMTLAIFAQVDRKELSSMEALRGKVIASYEGYGMEPALKRHLPGARIIRASVAVGMLRLVAVGKADAAVQEITAGRYLLRENFINNVVPQGECLLEGISHAIASEYVVRKDLPMLMSVLNKAYAAVDSSEKQAIWNKWFIERSEKRATAAIPFTAEEQEWLSKKHTVKVRLVDYPPYSYIGNGEPRGISIDYLKRIGERAGISLQFMASTRPFADALESLKKRDAPDLIQCVMQTPEREGLMTFSQSYLSAPRVIYIRADSVSILGLDELHGRTVAIPRGSGMTHILASQHPEIKVEFHDADTDCLNAVATGRADAYIGNLTLATYLIQGQGLSNLKVAAPSGLDDHQLSFGCRKDWPELSSIIDKTMAAIPPEEKEAIRNRYLSIRYDQAIDYSLIWKIISGACLVVALTFYWNRRMAREVHCRKHAERSAKEARDAAQAANKAKSVFLANMSHEIRTPLNAILGFSQLLQNSKEISEVDRTALDTISNSGQHLLALIDSILTMSKVEAGRISLDEQTFDVHSLLDAMSRMFRPRAEEKGLRFELEISDTLPRFARCDEQKLRQILMNLLSNAIKFTTEGSIRLKANASADAASENGENIHIEISDTGVGIGH